MTEEQRQLTPAHTELNFGSMPVNLQVAPQAIDKDLAAISAAVYDPNQVTVGAWKRLGQSELLAAGIEPSALEDPRSGFRAGLYANPESERKHVLAMAGTDMTSLKDWMTNLGQGLGMATAQYNEALVLAQDAKRAFGNELILTGHSLGGGLAAAAAAAIDAPAVTFNAAGVSDSTLKREGLDPDAVRVKLDAGQIRKYVVDGEVLDSLQGSLPIPKAPGYRITLEDPAPQSTIARLVPGLSMIHSMSLHGMASVEKAMDQDWRVSLASSAPTKVRGPNSDAADAWLKNPDQAIALHPELSDELQKASQAVALGVAAMRAGGATDQSLATVRQALNQRMADSLEHGKPIALAATSRERPDSRESSMERQA